MKRKKRKSILPVDIYATYMATGFLMVIIFQLTRMCLKLATKVLENGVIQKSTLILSNVSCIVGYRSKALYILIQFF